MKLASDYFKDGLGRSLSFLVGALVLGTAFPHLLNATGGAQNLHWKNVIFTTSILAVLGGFLILLLVKDGPYRKHMLNRNFSVIFQVFKIQKFRAAAFGYFGHRWELYAFWAFVPVVLGAYEILQPQVGFNIPLLSFLIIGSGGLACVAGGFISQSRGTKFTATAALFLSGACCLLSPLVFLQPSRTILVLFLLFWGMLVVADSPLFSTLIAKNAPSESRGTALTLVNCIGFALSILSIQLTSFLFEVLPPAYPLLFLVAGPVFGMLALFRKSRLNSRFSTEKV